MPAKKKKMGGAMRPAVKKLVKMELNKLKLGNGKPMRKKGKKEEESLFSKGVKFAKEHKLLSRGLSLIPHPLAKAASSLAGYAGYGKKKRVKKGKGLIGTGRLIGTGGPPAAALSGRLYLV